MKWEFMGACYSRVGPDQRPPGLVGSAVSMSKQWKILWLWRFYLVFKAVDGSVTEFLKRLNARHTREQ